MICRDYQFLFLVKMFSKLHGTFDTTTEHTFMDWCRSVMCEEQQQRTDSIYMILYTTA